MGPLGSPTPPKGLQCPTENHSMWPIWAMNESNMDFNELQSITPWGHLDFQILPKICNAQPKSIAGAQFGP